MSSQKSMLRSALLLTGFLAAVSHADTTIKVTTFLDENGANAAACSLREALQVVNDKSKKAFGGCPSAVGVGDIIVQLEAGTYTLTAGELQVLGNVVIVGAETVVADDEATSSVDESLNPYTGKAPYRKPPTTIIDAAGLGRVINSYSATGSNLTLKDVVLRNGRADYASNQGNGGAIYAAMSVALDNVHIEGSTATGQQDNTVSPAVYRGGMGGAVYLAVAGAGLSLSNATLQNNTAPGGGGAVAMVCEQNLDLAGHSVTASNSLLLSNSSVIGAGALEACGLASVSLNTSTISTNQSAAGAGAIRYLPTREGQGSVSISNITAAQNFGGAALAFGKLSSITLNDSVLVGNADDNCAVASGVSFTNGNYNALDDASCDALLIPSSTSTHANRDVPPSTWDTVELLPLGMHGGLTQVYLPRLTSANVLNWGRALGACGDDQRGFMRQSGTACDIGAVERQVPTTNPDTGDSANNAGRVAIIDVLDNDSFGETDTEPNRYADPAVTVVPAGGKCKWYGKNDTSVAEEYRNRLVVDNNRVITPGTAPISCTYSINTVPLSGGATAVSATTTVKANIKNIAPQAVPDVFVRPVGTQAITLDVLANDTDVDDSNGSLSIPLDTVDVNGDPIKKYAVVYISVKPQLGTIEGTEVVCPDSSASSPKTCLLMPIRYVAYNPQSPFTDSLQYAVYDEDDASSTAITVSIKTNAPDPDKGETGGSLDWAGLLLLSLFGLRRARQL